MQEEGSKLREDDEILKRTDTRITANSKDRNNCFDLTKLPKLDALHNARVTGCCCCGTGLLTEASGFPFAQIRSGMI